MADKPRSGSLGIVQILLRRLLGRAAPTTSRGKHRASRGAPATATRRSTVARPAPSPPIAVGSAAVPLSKTERASGADEPEVAAVETVPDLTESGGTKDISRVPAHGNLPDQSASSAAHATFAAQAHIYRAVSTEPQLEPLPHPDANEMHIDVEAARHTIADREPTVAASWPARPEPTPVPAAGEAAVPFVSLSDEEPRPSPTKLPASDPPKDQAVADLLPDPAHANSSEAVPAEVSGTSAGPIGAQSPSDGPTIPVPPDLTAAPPVSEDKAPRPEGAVMLQSPEPSAPQLSEPMPIEGEAVLPSPCNADDTGQRPMPSPEAKPTSAGAGRHSAPLRPSALDRQPPTPDIVFPEAYLQWNRILVEHCLLAVPDRAGPTYLSGTPTILAAALEAEQGELLSPEDAAADFTAAVSLAYSTVVLREPERLWALAQLGPDGVPLSVGFLTLSVLAAYQMHSDEESGPNAYYPRLASLLGCELVAGHPRGFDPVDFENLWDLLSSWLERNYDQALALPGPDAGLRRYIAYPLRHVPLRQVDIEKLPQFFDWAGLEPGSKAEAAFLAEAFERWASGRGILSRAGHSALADERRPAVEVQLALELGAWDGSWTDRAGCRTAAVHVLLDFRRGQPELFFLPRRPPSFPAIFDDGSHVFGAGEPGWYDPVPMVTDDGPVLESGFHWVCASPQGQVSLHRPQSSAIALRPAPDFTGFLSQRNLPLGVESAVLCTTAMEATTAEYLSTVTGARCRAIDHPAIPEGWRLFPGIVPRRSGPPPYGFDALTIESTTTVILRGGLRVGRRAAWLSGAPPTILVGGAEGLTTTVDGRPAIVANGVLNAPAPLTVGTHVVEAGRARKRLEIVEPEGRWDACAPLINTVNGPRQQSVAVPFGVWTIIGARPDQATRVACSERGTLLTVPFLPVWAISVGTRRGTSVALCLVERPPTPELPDFRLTRSVASAAAGAWSSAIYDAHGRRARLGWLYEVGAPVELRAAWHSYWLTSKRLKRHRRRLA